jgi:hypothetical protein
MQGGILYPTHAPGHDDGKADFVILRNDVANNGERVTGGEARISRHETSTC